jgi:hypothetical protein
MTEHLFISPSYVLHFEWFEMLWEHKMFMQGCLLIQKNKKYKDRLGKCHKFCSFICWMVASSKS